MRLILFSEHEDRTIGLKFIYIVLDLFNVRNTFLFAFLSIELPIIQNKEN